MPSGQCWFAEAQLERAKQIVSNVKKKLARVHEADTALWNGEFKAMVDALVEEAGPTGPGLLLAMRNRFAGIRSTVKELRNPTPPAPAAPAAEEPTSIQSAPIPKPSPPKDGFYSAAVRLIDQKMPSRAPRAQVVGMLTNPQSGVKADEIKWTGIVPWLSAQPFLQRPMQG